MKVLCFMLFIVLISTVLSQNEKHTYYRIQIVDATNAGPLEKIQVRSSCKGLIVLNETDSLGEILIACTEEALQITLSGEFYQTLKNLTLKSNQCAERREDTLVFKIFMEPKSATTTKEVVVTNPFKPNAIFASERLSVADFELLENNKLLLLTYERTLSRGAELLIVDENERILHAKQVGNHVQNLFTDFRGWIHLMHKNHLDYVYLEDDVMELVPMDKNYYERFVAPIIDTNRNKFYFTNYRKTYPAAEYFVYDDLDSTYFKMARVSDEIIMDLYLKEYLWMDTRTKLWAREMEQKTGIDKEDIVGEAIFTKSIFYKPIYAPFFLKSDTLYLFDFYKDFLFRFDKQGIKIDSLAITMHHQAQKTGWCNRLIQDPKTGMVYAIFDKGGYTSIRAVNLESGALGSAYKLDFRYVEKLIISDNAVYYTYRPFESKQKKFLYKQLLPLYFSESETGRDARKNR